MNTPYLRREAINENITLTELTGGLTFGTDAYLLAAYVRPRVRGKAVDLGSGTGVIPLLCLARNKFARCTAVEIQPVFCDLIVENARANGTNDRLVPCLCDLRFLTVADVGGEVDIVTANPPYMTVGSGARNTLDEKYIARHEVNGTIHDFCTAAGRLLKHGGRFFCVFRPDRLTDLMDALRQAHLEAKRMTFVQATAASRPSMVLVEAAKYARPSLLVTPILCLDSPAAAYVYAHCAFPAEYLGGNR